MDRYQINVLRYMNDGNPVTQINSTAGEYRIIATTLLVVGIIFGIAAVVLWFRFRIFHLFLMLSGIDARVSTDHTRDRGKKHKHATKAVTAAQTVHSETSRIWRLQQCYHEMWLIRKPMMRRRPCLRATAVLQRVNPDSG